MDKKLKPIVNIQNTFLLNLRTYVKKLGYNDVRESRKDKVTKEFLLLERRK